MPQRKGRHKNLKSLYSCPFLKPKINKQTNKTKQTYRTTKASKTCKLQLFQYAFSTYHINLQTAQNRSSPQKQVATTSTTFNNDMVLNFWIAIIIIIIAHNRVHDIVGLRFGVLCEVTKFQFYGWWADASKLRWNLGLQNLLVLQISLFFFSDVIIFIIQSEDRTTQMSNFIIIKGFSHTVAYSEFSNQLSNSPWKILIIQFSGEKHQPFFLGENHSPSRT